MSDTGEDQRRGIQSVEVGHRLLDVLARGTGRRPLKDLAAEAGMAPSKAHLYLVSYQRLGLVEQDPVTARYSLGPAAIRLGVAAINQTDLVQVARRHIDDAVIRAGVSISLSIWGSHGPTVMLRRDGPQPFPISVRLGFVLPVLSSSTGRVFLSHLPESAWSALVQSEGAVRPDLLDDLPDVLQKVRAQGFAITESFLHSGFFGISAPIFNGEGMIEAAVTGLGLSAQSDLGLAGPVVTTITDLARQISGDLGACET
jgi:DNA-binding IclR family transcriptional regulator